ncbi:P-loop containing nucleoside triphosphate hydrolase protein [Chytriomyces sp. MP71]|nr:P-loop containing nucleoside triphosphate hydrolase protein [Chytriomyces sp. MP71]
MVQLYANDCFATQRNLVDRLRAVGLDKYVELPQIAVMGDTSSGKSSLLSAISGIEFPSSDKLTTRCPTQIILSHAEEFHGSVRLVRYGASTKAEIKTYLTNPEQITDEIDCLMRQIHEEGQEISDDAIVIQVSGPQYSDLTLTDLPGIIRTVGDGENTSMIQKVSQLVGRYLNQSRTVVLAVVPANVDMHNSEILQMATKADPEGSRTIAIITKPDLVDEGAEQSVLDLLYNKRKYLKLGYHVVKCRGQKELNEKVSLKESRVNELQFFANHMVWKDVENSFVGIGNLTEKLIKILKAIIGACLPAVLEEIRGRVFDRMGQLTKLGPPIDTLSTKRVFYNSFASMIARLMENSLKGCYNDSFFSENNQFDNRLRAVLRKHEIVFQASVNDVFVEETLVERANVEVGDFVEVHLNHSWCLRKVDEVYGDEIVSGDAKFSKKLWRQVKTPDLNGLKSKIQDNRGDELAIFPSYNLFCCLVKSYVLKWEAPMHELFDKTNQATEKVIKRAVGSSAPKFPKLREYAFPIVAQALQETKEEAREALIAALEQEYRPYTLNHYLFDIIMKLRNAPLLASLDNLTNASSMSVSIEAVKAVLKNHGIGTDSYEDREALEMHNALKAYVKVAKKRFIDKIPMLIETVFIQKFLRRVKMELASASDAQLEYILQESESTLQHREALKTELSSLKAAQNEIGGIF